MANAFRFIVKIVIATVNTDNNNPLNVFFILHLSTIQKIVYFHILYMFSGTYIIVFVYFIAYKYFLNRINFLCT